MPLHIQNFNSKHCIQQKGGIFDRKSCTAEFQISMPETFIRKLNLKNIQLIQFKHTWARFDSYEANTHTHTRTEISLKFDEIEIMCSVRYTLDGV